MDFSNLWKHSYRFTHASFTQYITKRGLPLSAVSWQTVHCLAALPAKMSVFNSHMQGSHSVISNKFMLHTKINPYSYNKNRAVASGVQWCPDPHLKSGPPFHVWSPGCCIYPILYLKNIAPLMVFGAPCCEILATGLNKNKQNYVANKKYECVHLIWNDNRILI